MTRSGGKRRRAASRRDTHSHLLDPPGDGGPDEAAAFIAETAAELAALAGRHHLDVLLYLLKMTRLEAEERLNGRRRLS